MKCIIYLDDVHASNGPFAMLVNYSRGEMSGRHVSAGEVVGIVSSHASNHNNQRYHRFDVSTIAEAVRRGKGTTSAVELYAPAGSAICFDSGSIHHGQEIRGRRREPLRRAALTVSFGLFNARGEGAGGGDGASEDASAAAAAAAPADGGEKAMHPRVDCTALADLLGGDRLDGQSPFTDKRCSQFGQREACEAHRVGKTRCAILADGCRRDVKGALCLGQVPNQG